MNSPLTNWRVLVLVAALLLAGMLILVNGLRYGIDFEGGTSFQIKLAQPVSSPEQMNQILSIIRQRMDWTGLKDTTVTSIGSDIILADIAETDTAVVEQLESLILRQGKFEATLHGDVLFTGNGIVQISRDPVRGYGVQVNPDGTYMWVLPFILRPDAAQRFTELTFHQCEIIGVDPQLGRQYDCEKTYFFIDRPEDAVILMSRLQYMADRDALLAGDRAADIPQGVEIADLLANASIPVVLFDGNTLADDSNAQMRLVELSAQYGRVLTATPPDAPTAAFLESNGFIVTTVANPDNRPFVWAATGAKQVISLSEDVTNMSPYVDNVADAKVYSELLIRGFGGTQEEATEQLSSLTILLESGSLPIPVESISKETISPQLGEEFLNQAVLMGIVALLVVAAIIFIRYRQLSLVAPILATSLFEVFLVLGFAALIRWNLDLASVAGIIAAIGTGVNDQIVITDELLRRKGAASESTDSASIKRAFFIIMAAAGTSLATMLPIILFGFGLGKLVGFAITTTIGVLVGVLLTRPAFGEVARYLLSRRTN